MMSGMTGAERAEVMVRMTFGPNHGIGFSPDGVPARRQPRSTAASLKSAGFPRAPRSSQLEPFTSLSTAGSHVAGIGDKPGVPHRTGITGRAVWSSRVRSPVPGREPSWPCGGVVGDHAAEAGIAQLDRPLVIPDVICGCHLLMKPVLGLPGRRLVVTSAPATVRVSASLPAMYGIAAAPAPGRSARCGSDECRQPSCPHRDCPGAAHGPGHDDQRDHRRLPRGLRQPPGERPQHHLGMTGFP